MKFFVGCNDGPRRFAIEAALGTHELLGDSPSSMDDQLIMRHRRRKRDFIATKHMDDIEVACSDEVCDELVRHL